MKIFPPLVIVSSFLLSACFDDNLSKCQERLSKGMDLIALPYCEKAADEGDATAQELFAKLLLKRGETERAVEYFGKSANQKNASAMLALAEYYEVADPEKSQFYYKRACAANELKACEKEERLTRKQQHQSQQEALALEKAKAETATLEKEKLAAQIKAEELRLKKEQEQALKQKIGNRKFYNGLAKFQEGDLWGHINQKGEMVIPAQFAYAADFYDGLAAVKNTDGKWGYIYPSGKYAIRPQFSCVFYFNEGLAAVSLSGYGKNCQGGKWGFIDKSGNWVISPVLDKVETVFRDGVAKVTYNGQTGYINKQAQWVDMPTNTNGSNNTNNDTHTSQSLPFISQQDIKSAYANAVPRYQSQGILGGRNWVEDCYQKSNYKLGCYHFDQLISNIDKSMSEYEGFLPDVYFSQSNVEHRALTYIWELKQLSSADFRKVVDDTIIQLRKNSDMFEKYSKY